MTINTPSKRPELSEAQEAQASVNKLDQNVEGAFANADRTEKQLALEGKTEAELWELIRGQFETVDTRSSLDALKTDVEADLTN